MNALIERFHKSLKVPAIGFIKAVFLSTRPIFCVRKVYTYISEYLPVSSRAGRNRGIHDFGGDGKIEFKGRFKNEFG